MGLPFLNVRLPTSILLALSLTFLLTAEGRTGPFEELLRQRRAPSPSRAHPSSRQPAERGSPFLQVPSRLLPPWNYRGRQARTEAS